MPVLLAVLSTFSIGLGEFIADGLTKRTRSHEVTATMFFAGVVLMAIVLAVWPGDPSGSDLALGALAGVCNGSAILLLYVAYSRGSLRVAAPASAVVMSGTPVLWDLLITGTSPSTLVAIGIPLGVASIALTSWERADGSDGDDVQTTLVIAIVAGAVFGVLLILLSYVDRDAGGGPILLQRVVAFSIAAGVAKATGPRVFPAARRDLLQSLLIGVLAGIAVVLIVLAFRDGNLGVVSILSSQYAAVAVLLGVAFRGQRMAWWQAVGLAGASLAVGLIAAG